MKADDAPVSVLPPEASWPVFDSAGTRALERQALARHPPHALMACAGRALARLALATQPAARSVLALAGPGNNGGDAVVAARLLQACGWQARIVLLGDAARLPDDAAWALAQARADGLPVSDTLPMNADADLMIDGLLGLGSTRAPDGPLADAVRWLNQAGRPVIAVDLPTGLDADRGTLLGDEAVRATHTLSLLTLKPGLFTAEGRDHTGRVWLHTLGEAVPEVSSCRLVGPPPAEGLAPHSAHKGRFGDVLVVAGAPGMAGAARLAARAALAAGAGRVYLCLLDPAAAWSDDLAPELMHRPLADLQQPKALAARTVLCGCGGGEAVAAWLPPLFAHA
ncbi:MAG: NAD(P)H-hydrate epimerase, partial [Rubrivivax sp.]|nr:NAD(P)H-hydrate epimerase [Rubrivivax sp.]